VLTTNRDRDHKILEFQGLFRDRFEIFTGGELWLVYKVIIKLIYPEYSQVCFDVISRGICADRSRNFGRLIDGISVFVPFDINSSYAHFRFWPIIGWKANKLSLKQFYWIGFFIYSFSNFVCI